MTNEDKRRVFDMGVLLGALTLEDHSPALKRSILMQGILIPTDCIPDNVETAVSEYLAYQRQPSPYDIPCPSWMPEHIEGTSDEDT